MNLPQRIVLVLGIIVVAGITLFPPWIYVRRVSAIGNFGEVYQERSGGYHAIWTSAPSDQAELARLFSITEPEAVPGTFAARIDQSRLGFELIGAVIIAALLCVIFKDKK